MDLLATRLVRLAVVTGVLLSACSTEPLQDVQPPGHPAAGPRPDTLQIERVPLHDQPLTIAYDDGSLWVTTGRARLLRLRNDEIVERFPTGVTRGRHAWVANTEDYSLTHLQLS